MDQEAKRELALDLALRALRRLAPGALLAACVKRRGRELRIGNHAWDLSRYSEVLVIALGKAAVPMAQAWERLLPQKPGAAGRLVISAPEAFTAPGQSGAAWTNIEAFVGGHPEPNEDSLRAGRALLRAVASAAADSLIVYLLSGGGSALAEAPLRPDWGLPELRAIYGALVRNGEPIGAINAVRKHLSALKGGRLAAAAPRTADQLSLLLSDVPRGDWADVASGPSCPDPSTLAECRARMRAAPGAWPELARAALLDPNAPETPKPGDPAFLRCHWEVLADDRAAAEILAEEARAAGLHPVMDHTADEWDYAAAAEYLLARARQLRREDAAACLIAAGEVRVAVTEPAGRGGRNQMFALECARRIAGEDLCALSLGTDGVDGNSPAAGALVDGETLARARELGLRPDRHLAAFDAYPLLAATRDALEMGPTGLNVRDLRLIL